MARKTPQNEAVTETKAAKTKSATTKATAKETKTPEKKPRAAAASKVKVEAAKPESTVAKPVAKKLTLQEELEAERIAGVKPARKPRTKSTVAKKTDPAPEKPVEPETATTSGRQKSKAKVEEAKSGVAETIKSVFRPRANNGSKASPTKGAETVPDADTSLPVPSWRKPEKQAQKPAEVVAESESEVSPSLAPRRSRNRKRKDRRDTEITAVVAPMPDKPSRKEPPQERKERSRPSEPEPEPEIVAVVPMPPETPVRPPIPVPEGAAQVALLNGVPTIIKGKEVLPPIFFFASAPDESRMATVLEEVKLASESGIHVFSFLVELEVDPKRVDDAVAFAAFLVKKASAVDPDAQIILRTVFVASHGWERSYPKARYINEEGEVADPSVCDDEFWSTAEECLERYIAKLQILDKDSRILGVHLERGEWFFSEDQGYDRSEAARNKFQEWLRHRYRNDAVSLRAAWFDGSVSFEAINVPEYREMRKFGSEFVRTDRKARPWVDFHLFLSDSTCERIASLAYAAKRASGGHYLVGASYGYTFEWSHPASGHLSLGKLLRCQDLDYIGGPPSYKNREPSGTAPFPVPVDSFALNGKLYISEDDFKTPISGQREPDDFNPVMKTPQALGNVHWRGAGSALAHASGACWMDSWGNGWLNSRGIWERAQRIQEALIWSIGANPAAPDVAVFVDERSLAYLIDSRAFEVLVQNVRESILRSGLSAGFYLLSDLAHRENFPDCKLHVFMNAWDIRPEVRSAIKTRLQKDGKVLFWLYCAGLFEGGRESLERVREVTGIALRPQPFYSRSGTTILNSRDPLCQNLSEQALGKGGQLEPSYFAIPEDGAVLGEYSHTGLPSFVARRFESDISGSWHSVFLGEPVVTPGLFRSLGQMAGAHIWSFQNDVVHVKPPFLTIHCTGTAPRTLALPDKWTAYNLVEGDWAITESNSLKFQGLDGSTHSFMVGPKAEIESLLSTDPAELLNVNEVQPREDNTLHWDVMRFDVPIMKLDEWVEETWSEDLADDLLLKPSMIDASMEEGSAVERDEPQRSRGRRNKRRREGGDRDRGGDRESDMTVNVMFRKRD